jgi:hypothetical protein
MSKTRKASKYDTLFVDLRDEERIQFARLIDEMMAALPGSSATHMINDMAKSMDLSIGEVNKMLDYAMSVWEAAKPAA